MPTPDLCDVVADLAVSAGDWMRANGLDVPADLASALDAIKTQTAYRRQLWGAVRQFHAGQVDDGEFLDDMIAAIENQMRRAFREGLRNVGIDPVQAWTPDYEVRLQQIVNAEFNHVLGLATDIQAAARDGKPVDTFRSRIDVWANRYTDVVNAAQVMAAPDLRFKWVYGDTDHCSTCLALNGIVATGAMWEASGYQPQSPPNPMLECGGWRCQCRLVRTDEPLTPGGIPQV